MAKSREQARALILSGAVRVNSVRMDKVGTLVKSDAEIELIGETLPYVSRGGLKLEAAIKTFVISVTNCVVMDVGASTGGFTDCLLKHGAARVYAVDVGYGQLAWTLRQDSRVVVLEQQNIRAITKALVPEVLDFITIDVSFISLEKVIPCIVSYLQPGGRIVALIKPQFEVGKGAVGKGGIVRDPEKREEAVQNIRAKAKTWGLVPVGIISSPIKGRKGNIEYLAYFKKILP